MTIKKKRLFWVFGLILCAMILELQGCGSIDSLYDSLDINGNETDPGMPSPHFQLNGIVYVDQGEQEDELPAEYIYAGEISSGMNNGKVYINPYSTDQVYFWTLGWDEKRDGKQHYIVYKKKSILEKY